jgi:restriction system protein
LKIILDNDGSFPIKQILGEMEKRIIFNEYEKAIYERSGYIRWQSFLFFYSIEITKAGWLRKHKGVWYITEEGKRALELNAEEFIKIAHVKYREWAESQDSIKEKSKVAQSSIIAGYEQAQSTAREEIKNFIKNLNPYDFQDIVAALFRGMGYYTPFVAPPGPDGGIDIVAYKDPVGAELPRIKIQVKHKPETKVSRLEIAALIGDLQGERYVGIMVSTGGFSSDALNEIRNINKHVEQVNLERFIDLWEEYYDKLSDEDRLLLPLRKISFLAPKE